METTAQSETTENLGEPTRSVGSLGEDLLQRLTEYGRKVRMTPQQPGESRDEFLKRALNDALERIKKLPSRTYGGTIGMGDFRDIYERIKWLSKPDIQIIPPLEIPADGTWRKVGEGAYERIKWVPVSDLEKLQEHPFSEFCDPPVEDCEEDNDWEGHNR